MQILGSILVMVGIVAMAGAGGDCDGACGAGNDLGTMLLIAGGGLAMFLIGAIVLIRESW
jgi:hypothetical protein